MADTVQHLRIEIRAGDHDYYLGAFRHHDGTMSWQVTDVADPKAPLPVATMAAITGTLEALSNHMMHVGLADILKGTLNHDGEHPSFPKLHGTYQDNGAKLFGR